MSKKYVGILVIDDNKEYGDHDIVDIQEFADQLMELADNAPVTFKIMSIEEMKEDTEV